MPNITLRFSICNLGSSTWITGHQWSASKNSSHGFDAKIYENDDACAKFPNKENNPGSIVLLVHQKYKPAIAT
jgi:hypothetical protein